MTNTDQHTYTERRNTKGMYTPHTAVFNVYLLNSYMPMRDVCVVCHHNDKHTQLVFSYVSKLWDETNFSHSFCPLLSTKYIGDIVIHWITDIVSIFKIRQYNVVIIIFYLT